MTNFKLTVIWWDQNSYVLKMYYASSFTVKNKLQIIRFNPKKDMCKVVNPVWLNIRGEIPVINLQQILILSSFLMYKQ